MQAGVSLPGHPSHLLRSMSVAEGPGAAARADPDEPRPAVIAAAIAVLSSVLREKPLFTSSPMHYLRADGTLYAAGMYLHVYHISFHDEQEFEDPPGSSRERIRRPMYDPSIVMSSPVSSLTSRVMRKVNPSA
jgi:hypothetical protein